MFFRNETYELWKCWTYPPGPDTRLWRLLTDISPGVVGLRERTGACPRRSHGDHRTGTGCKHVNMGPGAVLHIQQETFRGYRAFNRDHRLELSSAQRGRGLHACVAFHSFRLVNPRSIFPYYITQILQKLQIRTKIILQYVYLKNLDLQKKKKTVTPPRKPQIRISLNWSSSSGAHQCQRYLMTT